MVETSNVETWDRLRQHASEGDTAALDDFMRSLEPGEAVRAILRLDHDDQQAVLRALSPTEAADLIEETPEEQAADLIHGMAASDAAHIVAEMQSDEQADLIADLERDEADAILIQLEPDVGAALRTRADYPDDVAGGLMITEYFTVPSNALVGQAMDAVIANDEASDDHFSRYVYVVGPDHELLGVAPTGELAGTDRDIDISTVMTAPLSIGPRDDLDELRDFFELHPIGAAPVIDEDRRLLGVTRRTAVLDAIAERTEREKLRMQGIIGGDEVRALPTLTRARRRLSWLSINIVLNIIAASVIALYIDTLDAVIALAVFLPIISDMSGASGNQAVGVSMRELSLGIIRPRDAGWVWLKEISVGLINGSAIGLLIAIVALVWDGDALLGLVVGTALAVNTLIAVSVGGTVPLLLRRFGVDPAVASGPILTTVTDICGFFLALTLASIVLVK